MENTPEIKLVCFDMDGTLINQNSWYELNMALGMTNEEDQNLFNQFISGQISYEEWTEEIFKIVKAKGLANKQNIVQALEKYTLREGAREIVAYLKDKGYQVVIISGAADLVVEMVAKDLGIELFKATDTLVFDEAGELQEIKTMGVGQLAKLDCLLDFCRQVGVEIENVAGVGDGGNDLTIFRATKRGITFTGSKIEREAWKVISKLNDIKTIL